MSKAIDRLAGVIEQLREMKTEFADSLAIGILFASIDVTQILPATAAIKTHTEDKLTRGDVRNKTIEEVKTINSGNSMADRATNAQQSCCIGHKSNRATLICSLNLLNTKKSSRLRQAILL